MRSLVFSLLEKLNATVVGPAYKQYGRKLYEYGTKIEGPTVSEDRLVPSLRKVQYNGKLPQLNEADFIAPNATIAGDVQLGSNSSVWYSATIIGSLPVRIGNDSIIQDRSYISRETSIGNNCFVGPNTVLQGATLGNRAFVGMGSTVRHATIEEGGVVAGGAVILDNVTVGSNELWAGNPAQFVRNITPTERQIMREHHQEQQLLAKIHDEEANKSFRELLSEQTTVSQLRIQEYINQNIENWDIPSEMEDWNFVEQRLLMKETITYKDERVSADPYQQDMSKFPEDFNLGDNKAVFGQVRARLSTEPHWDSKNVNSPYTTKK